VEDHKGHIFYYRRQFCHCAAQSAKKTEYERQMAYQDWRDQARRLADQAGLNQGLYDSFRFTRWNKERPQSNAGEVFDKVNLYIDQVLNDPEYPRRWLYLYGPNGNGKTHLGVAALRKIALSKLWRPYIVVWPELCQATKESWSSDHGPSEGQLWGPAKTAPILLLDDLDKVTTSEWSMEKLLGTIHCRVVRRLPTIITANRALDVLKRQWQGSKLPHVQDTGLAILSRIANELWSMIRFSGPDQRWID